MSAPQFTPGPWNADKPLTSSRRVFMPGDTVEIRDAGLQLVACLYRENLHAEQDAANARLIAAAPELYEALDPVNVRKAAGLLKGAGSTLWAGLLTMMADKQEAALVKARGEQ